MYTYGAVQPLKKLASALRLADPSEHRVFSVDDLGGALPTLGRGALKALLRRAVAGGILTRICHGVYATPEATASGLVLYHTAARLRADAFNYLSLESVLSDAGVISQIPMNWITLMSSGRSYVVPCGRFGRIEFVHTRKRPGDVAAELTYDSRCRLWRALVPLALRDLKATRRNLDLVDWQAAHEHI